MSYSVFCNEEYLWGPALQVGDYFLGNVRMLEQLLNAESGITSYVADTIEIDKVKLKNFVEKALIYFETTNNTPLIAMIAGTFEIILALNAKASGYYPAGKGQSIGLLNRSKKVFLPVEEYLKNS